MNYYIYNNVILKSLYDYKGRAWIKMNNNYYLVTEKLMKKLYEKVF